MKVCILTHTFPRFIGDSAAPFMDGVASGIQKSGNEVFVLVPFDPGVREKLLGRKYKVITYKYIFPDFLHKLGYSRTLTNDRQLKFVVYLLAPLMFFCQFLVLLKLVKKDDIDLISAHWILPNGFVASLVSAITGVPVVSTLPGSDVYLAQKNFIFSLMAKFSARISAAITSNSPQLLEDLAELGAERDKFSTIIYGVDPKIFRPDRAGSLKLRKQFAIDKNTIIILGVGRLVAKKGFRFLIESAPQVLQKYNKVVFIIVGDGDQKEELENLAVKLKVKEKFLFPGMIDYHSLIDFYNLADIFILPSIRDDSGNLDDQSVAVVEAMACGKPIITTNFPGYRLVVEDGVNGFLVPEKNSLKIADALIKLIKSQQLRERMGKKSRQLVVEKFSWDKIGQKYSQLFQKILASQK